MFPSASALARIAACGLLALGFTAASQAYDDYSYTPPRTYLRPLAADTTPTDASRILVLMLDASSSMDPHEYTIQLGAYRLAFLDQRFQRQLIEDGGTAVVAIEWGDNSHMIVNCVMVRSAQDATAIAQTFQDHRRQVRGSTLLVRALHAMRPIAERCAPDAAFRVLDISADGVADDGHERALFDPDFIPSDTTRYPALYSQREALVADGWRINTLPIIKGETDEEGNPFDYLVDFFREHVQGGYMSFTFPAESMQELGEVVLRKLTREMGYLSHGNRDRTEQ